MAESNVYLNGRVMPAGQATVSVSDAGLLHGASAFTTMLARNGKVFRIDRHLARLMNTVRHLHLRTDPSLAAPENLKAATEKLLEANGLTDARVRITLTAGSVQGGPPTTLITAETLPEYPAQWYEKGITVMASSFKQTGSSTDGYKTGCYLPRVLARQEAAAKGADEALWFTADGQLAEACFCNVFLVLNGKVHTPPLDTPVLPGMVREAVIELCGQGGIGLDDQSPLTIREMLSGEEMFLTSSTAGIRPVARVERHAVGDEKPGPVTRQIMEAYSRLLVAETI